MNNNSGSYNYSQPNINGQNISGQTINGVNNVGAYNMPNYTGAAQTANTNSQNFNTAQNNQVGSFTSAYNAAAQAMPSYQTLLNNANQQYNVPNLQNTATQLNNQVLQIPQTYSQATQGSDTNNNQLMQLIGQKQWELDPLAQAATNSAQTAQGLANNMVNYGIQNETQMLSPYANTVPLQQALTTGAYSNFTQQQQSQMDALNAQLQAGVTLSADQMAQLTSLQNQKTQSDALIAAAQVNQQYRTVSPSQGIYNAATNQYSTPYNPTATQIPGTTNTA